MTVSTRNQNVVPTAAGNGAHKENRGGEKEVGQNVKKRWGQNVENYPNNQTDNVLKENPKLYPHNRR